MPFSTRWIAEFAYLCPSPDLRHKLSLATAFLLFGSVACISGLPLLVAENDDAGRAFALARPADQPLIRLGGPETLVDTAQAAKVTTAEPIRSCQGGVSMNGDCDTGAVLKPLPLATDAPTAAEAATLQRDQPADGNPGAGVIVASTPPLAEDTPQSTDAATAPPQPETPLPQASAAKPQKQARHQARGYNPYDGSLFAFDHRSRARFRPLFW